MYHHTETLLFPHVLTETYIQFATKARGMYGLPKQSQTKPPGQCQYLAGPETRWMKDASCEEGVITAIQDHQKESDGVKEVLRASDLQL